MPRNLKTFFFGVHEMVEALLRISFVFGTQENLKLKFLRKSGPHYVTAAAGGASLILIDFTSQVFSPALVFQLII